MYVWRSHYVAVLPLQVYYDFIKSQLWLAVKIILVRVSNPPTQISIMKNYESLWSIWCLECETEIIAIYSIVKYFIYLNFSMLVDIDRNDINCDESLGCMYNFFKHKMFTWSYNDFIIKLYKAKWLSIFLSFVNKCMIHMK